MSNEIVAWEFDPKTGQSRPITAAEASKKPLSDEAIKTVEMMYRWADGERASDAPKIRDTRKLDKEGFFIKGSPFQGSGCW